MKTSDFREQYLPHTKMKVTYRGADDLDIRAGLLLDFYITGNSGVPTVHVDSFTNRILVEDIIRLESLGVDWV